LSLSIADLQNDPDDIDKLVTKVKRRLWTSYQGWRKNRQDHALPPQLRQPESRNPVNFRRLPGFILHDYGCTLKDLPVQDHEGHYVSMARCTGFIPVYICAPGSAARVTEIEVKQHHPPNSLGNQSTVSRRIFKVLLDLFVIVFLDRYFVKPIYLFGSIGVAMLGLSLLVFSLDDLQLRVVSRYNRSFPTPLCLFLQQFFWGIGVTPPLLLGLLAEIVMRTYFESQGAAEHIWSVNL